MSEVLNYFAGFALKDVLQPILVLLNLVVSAESWVMAQLMTFIGFVMRWQVASNNEVVQVSWSLARDITNIFFIVGLIIIAFATMFRTFGILQSFHWKSALPRFLIAAVLINLSLAISQTVVLTSNQVTAVMSGVLENSGIQMSKILKTSTLKSNYHVILSADDALIERGDNVPRLAQGKLADADSAAFKEFLEECQESESQANNSFWMRLADKAPRLALAPFLGPVGVLFVPLAILIPVTSFDANIDTGGVRATYQECVALWQKNNQSIGARVASALGVLLKWTGNTSLSAYMFFILTSLLNIFMLGMVIISLGAAVVFYMFRVMAIWILLFLSAFAFGFSWVQGGASLKKWWEIFLGWNVFGPLYLFVLIIGLTFLARQGDLVATLSTSSEVGAVGGLFQIIFFYIFTAVIFVGGLLFALNSSFAVAVKSTPILGAGAAKLGAFSAVKWSQAFGRRVAQTTRVPAYFQATKERVAQTYRERRPGILRVKTQEEMVAAARSRLGVHGGAQEAYALRTTRTKDASKRLETGLKDIVTGTDGKSTDPASVHTAKMEFLRSRMNRSNKDEALAARQQLMKFGDMSVPELMETQKDYLPGSIAQAEFAKQLRTGEGLDPFLAYSANVKSDPDNADAHAERFFGKILRNPSQFGKLTYSYINPDAPNYDKSLEAMKTAANRIWPPSKDPNSTESRARYQAKQKLIGKSDDPLAVALANKIFPTPEKP